MGLGEQLVLGGVDLSKENLKVLENISGVTKISVNADTATFYIKDRMAIAHILTYIENNDISFNKMNMLSPTLNDVFLYSGLLHFGTLLLAWLGLADFCSCPF